MRTAVIRLKNMLILSAAEKIQADCDMKATNIILQGLPADIYSLCVIIKSAKDFMVEKVQLLMQGGITSYVLLEITQLINDMNIYKMKMEEFQVNTKFLNILPPEWSFVVLVFSPGDDPIACLNKAMAFLTAVASSRFPTTNNQLRTSF
ncbi:hypothetical protein Tco_1422051, partial [Tanacetum coccineum]